MKRKLTEVDLLAFGWYPTGKIREIEISGLTTDSRMVKKGYGFIALDGTRVKGKDFVFEAIKKGASAVFVDSCYQGDILQNPLFLPQMPIFFSNQFLHSCGSLVSWFYGDPSRSQIVVGVTGTNGKTTIALALYECVKSLQKKAAYIGTLGIYLHNEKKESQLTTPDLITLHKSLSDAYKKKINYVFLEASSHGLHQGRLAGVFWNLAIFTNLSQDHLDYHKTMENYFEAKKILFVQLLENARRFPQAVFGAIIHVDTPWGEKLALWLKEQNPSFPVITVGEKGMVRLVSIEPKWDGYKAYLLFGQKTYLLQTKFLGVYNLMNLATVFLTLRLIGYEAEVLSQVISQLTPPAGRMEVISAKENRHIVIDYAHTPAALETVLKTLSELNPIRIIVVFGCGGERDKEKRPLMGKVASEYADFVILTNDNPRSEDPQQIISDIKKGITTSQYVVMPDRAKAIHIGLQILGPHEVLLIAGKGHENYQIIKGKKLHFSDREVVEDLLKQMNY